MVETAFVFAAGRGERMGELTKKTPKPLLQVAGRPLIDYVLEKLCEAGFKKIIVNLAYLGNLIEEHLENRNFDVEIIYSSEPYPLETGGALFKAKDFLGDKPFLVVNADVWTDYPFKLLAAATFQTGDMAHLVMVSNPPQHQSGDFVLSKKNRLELVVDHQPYEKEKGVHVTYSGIALFSPSMIKDYPHCRECFPLREVFDFYIHKNQISAELYLGEWQDVGTPERLAEINRRIS